MMSDLNGDEPENAQSAKSAADQRSTAITYTFRIKRARPRAQSRRFRSERTKRRIGVRADDRASPSHSRRNS